MALLNLETENGLSILAESGQSLVLEQTVANEIQTWKGAVEPSETSPSGNEIKIWKGAVEPAESTSSTADAFIGGVTRSVTRTLTRGVTEGWSWGA